MTKWFIKKTCIATEDNPSFPRAVHNYIYGKRQNLILNKVVKDVNGYSNWIVQSDRTKDSDFLEEFGYNTKKMAESILARSLKHPTIKDKFWNEEYSIISIDI